MKEEDIFGINSYEICSDFANSRLKFALARKYRLDHYAKTIGVNFSLFTAAFGYATFVALAVDTPSLKDDLADGNVRLLAEIDAFNFDTGVYDSLGETLFAIREERWTTNELLLKSCHIEDYPGEEDSTIKIRFHYEIAMASEIPCGFLKLQKKISKKALKNPDLILLTSVLVGERGPKNAFAHK